MRESKCKRRFVNDKHVSGNPPSAYTLLFASQNASPRLPSVFRSIILVKLESFSFVFRVYDACLRENETKKCKLHFFNSFKTAASQNVTEQTKRKTVEVSRCSECHKINPSGPFGHLILFYVIPNHFILGGVQD